MKEIKASVITIGDELLIGQVIDTNAAWISSQLIQCGFWIRKRVTVGDQWQEIWASLDEEIEQSSLIILTGGLGPTSDDITKPLLCSYFNSKLAVDPSVLENIKKIFRLINRPLTERNLAQAEVPDNCTVIPNPVGTAPGMWFERSGKVILSLPGVPTEMKAILNQETLQKLKNQFSLPYIGTRTLLLAGIGESFVADRIQNFEKALPPEVRLAYLPNYGMLRLRLTAVCANQMRGEQQLSELVQTLKPEIAPWLVTENDISMAEVVGNLLRERKWELGTAESCTGGYLAHLITSIPGSSQYFKGSVVSYSNSIKESLLGVDHQTLATYGAVSEQTAKNMVQGALHTLNVNVAIAVTGIMGPGGGSDLKPIGTVWIAVGSPEKVVAEKIHLRFDRIRNIDLAAQAALNALRRFIIGS